MACTGRLSCIRTSAAWRLRAGQLFYLDITARALTSTPT